VQDPIPDYAELNCRSNYSFLTAASHPEELVSRAWELGYRALALTDDCSLAGVVRAHGEAKNRGLHLIVGSELRLADGMRLVVLATDRRGYGNLSHLISRARRRSSKGEYRLERADLEAGLDGCLALWLAADDATAEDGRWLAACLPGRVWLGVELYRRGGDCSALARRRALGAESDLPLVAAGGVLMHLPGRKPLLDTLTAIRLGIRVDEAGDALEQNRERYLRSRVELRRFYPEDLLAATLQVAAACRFSLDELHYEYPRELVPAGESLERFFMRVVSGGEEEN
jgi:error-prone DNA polymerase